MPFFSEEEVKESAGKQWEPEAIRKNWPPKSRISIPISLPRVWRFVLWGVDELLTYHYLVASSSAGPGWAMGSFSASAKAQAIHLGNCPELLP